MKTPLNLEEAISKVVSAGNCSGCGACTLLSRQVQMELSSDGFMRPIVNSKVGSSDNKALEVVERFSQMCPGVAVKLPPVSVKSDPYFGNYIEAWASWSTDEEIRFRGSSGGVITSLVDWVLSSESDTSAVSAQMDKQVPSRAIPVRITSRQEVLESAGSRYQPVATCSAIQSGTELFVGKPCETAAVRAGNFLNDSKFPLISFFCAGTPSQKATASLLSQAGIHERDVDYLQYRGRGWPGKFLARTVDGREIERDYQESWGEVLGRDVQYRCKICIDATGELADIAVGDLWNLSDDRSRPSFEESPGKSILIARTQKGRDFILEAIKHEVITGEVLPNLEILHTIQKHQMERRQTLGGRVLGRTLAGFSVPHYSSAVLAKNFFKRPVANSRAFLGSFVRSVQSKRTHPK